MRKYLHLLVLCIFCFSFAKAQTISETEPNNTWDVAKAITLGATGIGTAALNSDEDWWKVAIPGDGKLTIDWASTNGQNVYCQIYDTLGTILLISSYTTGSSTQSVDGLAKGTYYLRFVAFFTTENTTYSFSPTFIAASVANDPVANETVATASVLPLNGSVTGHIGYRFNGLRDDNDWWKVTVNTDGRLDFTITSSNGQNVYAQLYDGDGITFLAGSYTTNTTTYSKDGLAPGLYYINVRTYYNSEFASYTLSNTLTPPTSANDAVANETAATATVLPLNGSVTGHIGYQYNGSRDDKDWWKITVNADGRLDYTITSDNGQNVYAQLYDGDGTTYLAGSYTTNTTTYSKDGLAPGVYYIYIQTLYNNEFTSYQLSNTLVQPTQANDIGANDVYTTASTLTLNGSTTGHTGYQYNGNRDNNDWWKVTVNADGRLDYTITSGNGQNVYAQLYDGDGTTFLAGSYTTNTATYSKDGLAAGTYYLRIQTYYTFEFAPYTLSNSLTTIASPNDAEPNNTRATASVLAVNTTVTGNTGYQYNGTRDDFDYYAVTLPSDGKLSWTITSVNGQNVYAQLYDNDGTTFLEGSYTSGSATYSKDGLAAGTYYILIRTFYTSEFSPYTLANTFTPLSFAAENAASNKFAAIGTLLPANIPTTGHANYYYNLQSDTADWWQIGYDGNGTMNLTIEQEPHSDGAYNNLVYQLYADTTAAPILSSYFSGASNVFNLTGLAVGKYYLRIATFYNSEFVSYRLTAGYTEKCANVVSIGSSSQLAGCLGTITYNITGGLAPYSVQLYKDGVASGAIQSSNGAITFNNLGTGVYYSRSYSFGGSGLCNNISATTTFAAPATPTISGTLSFCTGGSTTLTSSVATSYLWSPGGQTTRSIIVIQGGSYSVTVKNATGCSSAPSAASVVTVNPLPTVTLSPFNSVCNTLAAFALTGGSPAGGTYSGTAVSNGQFNPAQAAIGNNSITYSYTNSNGCTNTAQQTLAVTNCSACNATINPGGATTFCTGGSVMLTASAGVSYLWNTGATSQSITVSTGGSYSVTVTNANNCSATSPATLVTVNTLPGTPTISGTLSFCTGGSTTLTSSVATSYLWSNGATTQSTIVTTAGSYSVTVNNAAECSSAPSAALVVTVNPLPTVTLSTFNSVCNTLAAFALTGGSPAGGTYSGTAVSNGQFNPAQAAIGNNTVTYSYTNSNGCTNTAQQTIAVTNCSACNATINPEGATTFCTGGSVLLTASAGVSYLWSNGATSQSITATTGGSYTVTVTNANNCSATSPATLVTVNALPGTPTISGTLSFCTGGSTTLTSSVATSYLWSNGATTQSTIVTTAGSYSVTVNNAAECSSAPSAALVVTVNPLPTVTLSTFNSVCNTLAAFALTGGSPAGGTYSGTAVSNGQFNPAQAAIGNNTVTYSYTNSNGCTNTAQQTIAVTNCSACNATINPGGATTFCTGGSVLLTASAGVSYLWSTGATSQSITATTGGSYTVTVTNANNCSATSAATVVTVNALPATPTISGTLSICTGGSTTLTSSAATSYLWSPGGQTTQSITVATGGSYSVTVKNAAGCSAASSAIVITENNCGGNYCTAGGSSNGKGFIQNVSTCYYYNNTSGWNNGYADFTRFAAMSSPGRVIGFSVTPGYTSTCNMPGMCIRVWIDWNADGDFADAGELVFCPPTLSNVKWKFWVRVPVGTTPGDKRMRVQLSNTCINNPCTSFTYGEVEDYTVKINTALSRISAQETFSFLFDEDVNSFKVYPNPASSRVVIERGGYDESVIGNNTAQLTVTDLQGKVVMQQRLVNLVQAVDVSRLANGVYMMTIYSNGKRTTSKIVVNH